MPTVLIWLFKVISPTKFVLGVVATLMALALFFIAATIGLAALTKDPDENRMDCSGVSWDTPYELQGVNYLERLGQFVDKLSDGKDEAADTYYFVRAVGDTLKLWRDAFAFGAFDDLEAAKAVTGYRTADAKAREKALRNCCVQLRAFTDRQGAASGEGEADEPDVEVAPGVPDPQPWDPKMASFAKSRKFSADQQGIAAVARSVAAEHGIPERGVVVILAAGFQESGVANLNFGDRDSLGWLQQRPSAGWGTPQQIRNPRLAAEAFFGVAKHTNNRGLLDVQGWEEMPVTRAVYRVQVSAFPNGAAQFEDDARALLASIGGAGKTSPRIPARNFDARVKTPAPRFDPSQPLGAYCAQLDLEDGKKKAEQRVANPRLTGDPAAVVWPVPGQRVSTYPNHDGVDINRGVGVEDLGDQVVAAASGVVTHVGYGRGYGQAVFIQTDTGYRTVYGHLSAVQVTDGARVTAGQPIGKVGSTGNSSGPHLHFGVFPGGTYQAALQFLAGKAPNRSEGVQA